MGKEIKGVVVSFGFSFIFPHRSPLDLISHDNNSYNGAEWASTSFIICSAVRVENLPILRHVSPLMGVTYTYKHTTHTSLLDVEIR